MKNWSNSNGNISIKGKAFDDYSGLYRKCIFNKCGEMPVGTGPAMLVKKGEWLICAEASHDSCKHFDSPIADIQTQIIEDTDPESAAFRSETQKLGAKEYAIIGVVALALIGGAIFLARRKK